MKRVVLYILILTGIVLIPVRPSDVGELEPIQAVWLTVENETVTLQTDTQDKGSGATVSEALKNMKLLSEGIVFLDTAQFLLVSENAIDKIAEIEPYLKGSVKVCLWDGEGELCDAAKYMQAHRFGCRLSQWQIEVKLPNLPL